MKDFLYWIVVAVMIALFVVIILAAITSSTSAGDLSLGLKV